MNQNNLRRRLKICKLQDNDFTYQEIADMLGIKIGSLYNFLAGAYDLSRAKAKDLEIWLSYREL